MRRICVGSLILLILCTPCYSYSVDQIRNSTVFSYVDRIDDLVQYYRFNTSSDISEDKIISNTDKKNFPNWIPESMNKPWIIVVSSAVLTLYMVVCMANVADAYLSLILVRVSDSLGLSEVVAGVTVLAFGNAAPDIILGITASAGGSENDLLIYIGEVLGSTLFNIALIPAILIFVSVSMIKQNQNNESESIKQNENTLLSTVADIHGGSVFDCMPAEGLEERLIDDRSSIHYTYRDAPAPFSCGGVFSNERLICDEEFDNNNNKTQAFCGLPIVFPFVDAARDCIAIIVGIVIGFALLLPRRYTYFIICSLFTVYCIYLLVFIVSNRNSSALDTDTSKIQCDDHQPQFAKVSNTTQPNLNTNYSNSNLLPKQPINKYPFDTLPNSLNDDLPTSSPPLPPPSSIFYHQNALNFSPPDSFKSTRSLGKNDIFTTQQGNDQHNNSNQNSNKLSSPYVLTSPHYLPPCIAEVMAPTVSNQAPLESSSAFRSQSPGKTSSYLQQHLGTTPPANQSQFATYDRLLSELPVTAVMPPPSVLGHEGAVANNKYSHEHLLAVSEGSHEEESSLGSIVNQISPSEEIDFKSLREEPSDIIHSESYFSIPSENYLSIPSNFDLDSVSSRSLTVHKNSNISKENRNLKLNHLSSASEIYLDEHAGLMDQIMSIGKDAEIFQSEIENEVYHHSIKDEKLPDNTNLQNTVIIANGEQHNKSLPSAIQPDSSSVIELKNTNDEDVPAIRTYRCLYGHLHSTTSHYPLSQENHQCKSDILDKDNESRKSGSSYALEINSSFDGIFPFSNQNDSTKSDNKNAVVRLMSPDVISTENKLLHKSEFSTLSLQEPLSFVKSSPIKDSIHYPMRPNSLSSLKELHNLSQHQQLNIPLNPLSSSHISASHKTNEDNSASPASYLQLPPYLRPPPSILRSSIIAMEADDLKGFHGTLAPRVVNNPEFIARAAGNDALSLGDKIELFLLLPFRWLWRLTMPTLAGDDEKDVIDERGNVKDLLETVNDINANSAQIQFNLDEDEGNLLDTDDIEHLLTCGDLEEVNQANFDYMQQLVLSKQRSSSSSSFQPQPIKQFELEDNILPTSNNNNNIAVNYTPEDQLLLRPNKSQPVHISTISLSRDPSLAPHPLKLLNIPQNLHTSNDDDGHHHHHHHQYLHLPLSGSKIERSPKKSALGIESNNIAPTKTPNSGSGMLPIVMIQHNPLRTRKRASVDLSSISQNTLSSRLTPLRTSRRHSIAFAPYWATCNDNASHQHEVSAISHLETQHDNHEDGSQVRMVSIRPQYSAPVMSSLGSINESLRSKISNGHDDVIIKDSLTNLPQNGNNNNHVKIDDQQQKQPSPPPFNIQLYPRNNTAGSFLSSHLSTPLRPVTPLSLSPNKERRSLDRRSIAQAQQMSGSVSAVLPISTAFSNISMFDSSDAFVKRAEEYNSERNSKSSSMKMLEPPNSTKMYHAEELSGGDVFPELQMHIPTSMSFDAVTPESLSDNKNDKGNKSDNLVKTNDFIKIQKQPSTNNKDFEEIDLNPDRNLLVIPKMSTRLLTIVSPPFTASFLWFSALNAPPRMFSLFLSVGIVFSLLLAPLLLLLKRQRLAFAWSVVEKIYSALSFLTALAWLKFHSGFIIDAMQLTASTLGTPPSFLSVSLLSAGASASDVFAALAVAKVGRPLMALTAAYAAPVMNIFLGVGTFLCSIASNSSFSHSNMKDALLSKVDGPLTVTAFGCITVAVYMLLKTMIARNPKNNKGFRGGLVRLDGFILIALLSCTMVMAGLSTLIMN